MATLHKQNTEDIFEITPLQEGLLFHYLKYDGNSDQNFEQICLNLHGKQDEGLLRKAWKEVVAHNEMLRAVFRWKNLRKPVQVILKKHEVNIHFHDISNLDSAVQEIELERIKREDKSRLFDLEEVPFRVQFIRTGPEAFSMLISNHSIIYDGWSNGIILKEFFSSYQNLLKSKGLAFEPKGKFKDYVKAIKEDHSEQEGAFWSEYLQGLEENSELLIRSKHSDESLSSSSYALPLRGDMVDQLDQFCIEHKITKATFYYAVWGILLQKISGSKDVVFGTTVSGRSVDVKGINGMVGLLINTLPLRVKNKGQQVIDLVKGISDHLIAREAHETTPLLDIRKYAHRSIKESFFETVVLIENYPLDKDVFKNDPDCQIDSFSFDQTNNFDLAISIVNFEKDIDVHFGYNRSKYDLSTIETLAEGFLQVAKALIERPEQPISAVQIISPSEKEEVVHELNETTEPYSSDLFIHQLFEKQVAINPDQIAIAFGGEELSYAALNDKSNYIADQLHTAFEGENALIPVIMDRTPDMILAIMGILKAGCAYVPLEPSLPPARIVKLVDSLGAKAILTDPSTKNLGMEVLQHIDRSIDTYCLAHDEHVEHEGCLLLNPSGGQEIAKNVDLKLSNESLAYIIFTSGSTGLPKGVAVQHKPVINIIEWMNKTFSIGHEDRLLFVTSLGFDLSVYDVFGTLAAGGTIRLASQEEREDPQLLLDIIQEEGITIWDTAPPAFDRIVQYGHILKTDLTQSKLRLAFLSGDWIGLKLPDLAKTLFGDLNVVSLGGATEAVIWSNHFQFDQVLPSWNSIPYGRPIQNAKYYILDEDLNPLPKGIIGELFIGGECLAKEYINEPALTAQKFLPNPFEPEGRIYRTGDLARWFDDGNIELIGRKDHQVKIRGYRIELGEIETCLNQYPQIRNKAVLVHQNQLGEKQICVFYVSDEEVSHEALLRHFASELPEYMVPSHLVRVDELPITSNGKLDRKSLLSQLKIDSEEVTAGLSSPVETDLAAIWAEVLKLPVDTLHGGSNFFDHGGHSLNATLVQAKIEKHFEVQVPLREVFNYPVLSALAEKVADAKTKIVSIPIAADAPHYPVSSGQMRLYSLQTVYEESIAYNISGCVKIEGSLDEEKLGRVVDQLIATHEGLRTIFQDVNHEIVQVVLPTIAFDLEKYELGQLPDFQDYIQPFDLHKGPLFRLVLFQVKEVQYLLLDMHHIISDGLSVNKFLKDFMDAYNGKTLTPPARQFKDYAVWSKSEEYGLRVSTQEAYWVDQFKDGVPRLNLPVDHTRIDTSSQEGDFLTFTLDARQANGLHQLASGTDATLFNLTLTLINVLLAKVCGQSKVTLGIPAVNRPHDDLVDTLGFFVNTLVLKNEVLDDLTFLDFLRRTNRQTLTALENQEYPLSELIDRVEPVRNPVRHPMFDVLLEFDNLEMPELHLGGLKMTLLQDIIKRAKLDLVFSAYPGSQEIRVKIEYAKELYDRATIEWMRDSLLVLVDKVLDDVNQKIGDLSLFSAQAPEQEEEMSFIF